MTSLAEADAPFRPVADAVLAVAAVASELGRDDLAGRLRIAVARLTRPTTIVCVVGEFKQGKSSLVNAIVGESICPVDDDLATSALTLLRYGDERRVEVRRTVGQESLVESSSVEDLGDWVSEAGNPGNAKGVERVDVAVPNSLLAKGIAFVDTPGMGSLGAGHAAATLAFLPFADALVFVSDASAELSAPELEFLQRARELCPTVLFALTKTDLHASWRRVADLNAGHLSHADVELVPLPVSSQLRTLAVARSDETLNRSSGFPALYGELSGRVLRPAKQLAARRAVDEAQAGATQLETTLRSELSALTDPEAAAQTASQAAAVAARLEHLRGPGARWSVLVGDRVVDLTNDVTFVFRGRMRQITRDLETEIENLKTGKDWDELARSLQTQVAEAVTTAFTAIAAGAQSTREDVVDLLAEETLVLNAVEQTGLPFDVQSLWSGHSLDPQGSKAGRALGTTLSGLRGAQSGIIMFGMMARFLPAGVGALLMTNPVTLGLGVAFGGMQIRDAQSRKVAQRRQQARAHVRQFVDDVQFEVGNAMSEALRAVQRSIRDEFTDRVGELQRTYADASRQATEAATRGADDAARRTAEVTASLDAIAAARAPLAAALAGASA
ncbi:MAG: dynamin family protein [Frankiaceae bacterium]|nr:dynamin family protein [Frankiaceae bacterium]